MKGEGGEGWWLEYKPAAGMVFIQLVAATMALINRAALVQGMSPRVFIFYRQAMATLFIFFFAILSTRKNSNRFSMGLRGFGIIFILALIGVTINQNLYFEGLYLASSSAASAIANLVPAITFLIASFFGLERVNIKKWSTIAKILGTITCVGGAASIALLKGPKLLNASLSLTLRFGSVSVEDTWLLGCFFLFANSISWSLWLILQVPATAACPDHLSISLWTCLLSTLQTGLVAVIFEPNWDAWNMSSTLELTCIFFSGIAGSGLQYIIQAWCISRRGPLYSAMFNPLSTVIVTILAAIFLHEQVFVGRLLFETLCFALVIPPPTFRQPPLPSADSAAPRLRPSLPLFAALPAPSAAASPLRCPPCAATPFVLRIMAGNPTDKEETMAPNPASTSQSALHSALHVSNIKNHVTLVLDMNKVHFVREKVAMGQVRVLHELSAHQYADIFTKGLPTPLFTDFRFSLCIRSPPAATEGGC